MSLIHHILLVVAFPLVAAVVAVGLPQVMPRIGQVPAAVFGVVFLAGSALLHEVFLRQEGESRMAERMRGLQVDFDEIRRRLNRVLDRVDLYLQPIVSLPQRKRKYFETFTRIRDGRGRMVVPSQYITIAEREGLITAIDNMLLFRCVQLVRQSQHQNSNVGFFCNISAHSLSDRHFFRNFVEFVADNTVLAPNLIFEFAQSTVIDGDRDMDRLLDYLASRGFRFSIDQVGSLNLDCGDLARRHFEFVKIDAATVMNDLRSGSSRIAPEDVKRMIERHGIDLIVEKIESEPMLLDLLDLRIDFGQGYLFGEPRITRLG